jgi:HSP20 family molecular chaperone IbpA
MTQQRWSGPEWDREWERSRADTEPGFGYRQRADYTEGGDRYRAWNEPWGPWEARPERGAGRRHEEPLWERVKETVKKTFAGKGPKGFTRSDSRILEDVCELLMEHPEVDPTEIEVTVQAGEVTLTGTVTERRQKRLAEDVASEVMGVKDVANRLRVEDPSRAAAAAGSPVNPGGWSRDTH